MKNIHIRLAKETDRSSWDSYVLSKPDGTGYQLFAWSRAVERAYGFRPVYLSAEQEGKVCGIFPMIHFHVPYFGKNLISLPYCDSGGLLADNEEVARLLWNEALALARKRHCNCRIRSNYVLQFAGENRTEKVRMVLELPENSEILLAGLKSKLRSQVKKPQRDGLSARMGTGELLSDFYRIFTENMRDLGSPVHSRHWFQAIVDFFGERVRVAVVYMPDGKPGAAGIILLHPKIVSIPWASSLRIYNRLNPNMLLYWTFLSFAADNGYKYFDFGRSSPGEGTWRFKEQWGAVPKPLYWYEWKVKGEKEASERSGSFSSGTRRLAAGIWSKLPLSCANRLGPRIRKYISL